MASTYNNRPTQKRQGGADKGGAQNRKPTQRKRKRSNPDNYLFIFIGLILVAVIIIGVLIFVTSKGDDSSDMDSSDSSSAGESSFSEESSDMNESSVPEVLKNAWSEENGIKYYYDEKGDKATGKVEISGSVYVFAEDGKMLSDCWQNIDGEDYYLLSDGKAAVGETEIDGKKYFFSSKGINFIVANPWNAVCSAEEPIDKSVMVRLPNGYGDQQADKGLVHPDCYDDLIAMMDDCYAATGKEVYVISGFRTYNYQKNNFERQVNSYLSAGYSRSEAERLAAEWVAVPGTSEHHLGYAVDIIDTQIWDLVEEQETLEGQQWMMENCWKYGFILRYPKNTKDETGINYEPWHYRYLGKEIAKEVNDSGLTLEKYIESLG